MNDRSPPNTGLAQALQQRFAQLAPREQRAITVAAWLVGLALLWWLALAPALATLRAAPARHQALDQQLARMQALAASAEALRAQNGGPPPEREAAVRALLEATRALGDTAQLNLVGERATLTLTRTSPAALAQWLAQVRINARVLPISAQLQRSGQPETWNGQIVLAGPGLGGAP
jgi:general secretion pathway protein M